MPLFDRTFKRFEFLYGSDSAQALNDRLKKLLDTYSFTPSEKRRNPDHWSQKDAILITYADVIEATDQNGTPKINFLERFLDTYVGDSISSLHLLPFFPSSSDEGFAVIDYKEVRKDIGKWEDVERLAHKYRLMCDLVINHTSRFSPWFKKFEEQEEPWKDYFIDVEPGVDLSGVTRPRSTPLKTTVETKKGLRYVWTTFSDDQIDLNFSNPDVLIEFLDIFLFYLSKGIQLVRLDAIAYLWKHIGTSSIHLDQTHEVVKLFRDIVDFVAPDATLITETNVPFFENLSYFGDGDEAHMIYQFSLPPLLLHAIVKENAKYLTQWASQLPDPPENCTYFNFTASHDGIGVRPLEGLVPDEDFEFLSEGVKKRGGFVSYKRNRNNTHSPYELNITFFDALSDPDRKSNDLQIKRYICTQIIMLSLQGVPGIYFHNLVAAHNDVDRVIKTGRKRSINRKRWPWDEIHEEMENTDSTPRRVLETFKKLLNIRKQHSAFHPDGDQEVLEVDDAVFAFVRTSPKGKEQVLVVSNVTSGKVELKDKFGGIIGQEGRLNLLEGNTRAEGGKINLDPFETVWLKI